MVCARTVGLGLQLFAQAQQVGFQAKFKIGHGQAAALAAPGQPVRLVEGFKTANMKVKVLVSFRFSKIDSVGGQAPHTPQDRKSEIRSPEAQFPGAAAQRKPKSKMRNDGTMMS